MNAAIAQTVVPFLYAVTGVLLAVKFEPLRFFGSGWYQSTWFPLTVACFCFAVVSIWIRFPIARSAFYGLLITGPPYSRPALLVILSYINPGKATVTLSDFAAGLSISLGLMLSGALLNPMIAFLVGMLSSRATPQRADGR